MNGDGGACSRTNGGFWGGGLPFGSADKGNSGRNSNNTGHKAQEGIQVVTGMGDRDGDGDGDGDGNGDGGGQSIVAVVQAGAAEGQRNMQRSLGGAR